MIFIIVIEAPKGKKGNVHLWEIFVTTFVP